MEFLGLDADSIRETARVLNSGGVAVIPTDTVYGLAAHPAFPDAVRRLYTVKNRPLAKPIALLAADVEAVERFGGEMSAEARTLAARHWPGALTMVIPCGGIFEGFRVPDFEPARELLRLCGGLLRVSSANLSGSRPATDAPAALKEVGLDADVVLDGGVSPGGVPSTVVKIISGKIEILRQGNISVEETIRFAEINT
jgi:L-threonylcarbamoyladenylate synthase